MIKYYYTADTSRLLVEIFQKILLFLVLTAQIMLYFCDNGGVCVHFTKEKCNFETEPKYS